MNFGREYLDTGEYIGQSGKCWSDMRKAMGCVLIAFVLPKTANRACHPHIVYQFELGGVPLKTQEIIPICRYTKEEVCIAQIIQDSFEIFLKKELQNVEKYLCAAV